MKHKKVTDALNEISDKYLMEAAGSGKRKLSPWLGTVAAILAIALLWGFGVAPYMKAPSNTPSLSVPDTTPPYTLPDEFRGEKVPAAFNPVASPYLLSAPAYPQMVGYGFTGHSASEREIHATDRGSADSLKTFFDKLVKEGLVSQEGNVALSPVNIYLALAMLAETAEGNSRQQILDLMGLDSIEALRKQADQVWRANYWNDGLSTSVLASSLWLDERLSYNEAVVNTLSESYYASVFRGQMGSTELNNTLQDWLNKNTGELLSDYVKDVKLTADAVMSLATAIHYQAEWHDFFPKELNTEDIFRTPTGDKTVTFMHTSDRRGYYWGEGYSAICLPLKSEDLMWLILPDEGKTPADLLSEGKAIRELMNGTARVKRMLVNLSLPKFDISSKLSLVPTLQKLGITDVFSPLADFSALIPQTDDLANPYVESIEHAARVSINEDGVTAAAYTLIIFYGATAQPPVQEEIDFVLDRPFLFVVQSDNMPLFTGIVNNP